jgi:hypothetical protein
MRLQKLAIIPDLLSSIDPTVDLVMRLADGRYIKSDMMVDPARVSRPLAQLASADFETDTTRGSSRCEDLTRSRRTLHFCPD